MGKTIHMMQKNTGLRSSAIALASCLVLSGMPLIAQAAGLGKLVVLSPLGQPLRAEIEVSATREELADMKAQLASPETFKQAGVDYATSLLSIRFNLDKRPNGQSIIRLSSDKPINDPFIDMLLELNWPAGRLVREYTFLLDPPEAAPAKAQVPVATATAKATTGKSTVVQSATSAVDDDVRAKAAAHVRSQSEAIAAEPTTEGGRQAHRRRKRSGHWLLLVSGTPGLPFAWSGVRWQVLLPHVSVLCPVWVSKCGCPARPAVLGAVFCLPAPN